MSKLTVFIYFGTNISSIVIITCTSPLLLTPSSLCVMAPTTNTTKLQETMLARFCCFEMPMKSDGLPHSTNIFFLFFFCLHCFGCTFYCCCYNALGCDFNCSINYKFISKFFSPRRTFVKIQISKGYLATQNIKYSNDIQLLLKEILDHTPHTV